MKKRSLKIMSVVLAGVMTTGMILSVLASAIIYYLPYLISAKKKIVQI